MSKFPIVFHPFYEVKVTSKSRFPIRKYSELKNKLETEGILQKSSLFVPHSLDPASISLTHDQFYVNRVQSCSLSEKEKRKIGLPEIDLFCQRSFLSAGGTFLAAKLALKFGFAANAAGGSHHAEHFGGSGFCIFNDVAIAVNCLLADKNVENVLILDFDVHQGDGTARIFELDERVFTVSMHCEKNFPLRKAKSNLDVGLESGVGDEEYLFQLDRILADVARVPADLIIYNAGVDIHKNDTLGHLCVSSDGVMSREKKVVAFALERAVPLVVTLGGGYQKNVANLATLHSMIFQAIIEKQKM